MNRDLHAALITSADCSCARDVIRDDDRLPRAKAARVMPDLSDVVNEAWQGIA